MSKREIYVQRDREILESLAKHDFISIRQIQRMHQLGSASNARRVIKNLNEYIGARKLDENVYFLNEKGKQLMGVEKRNSWADDVFSRLMMNDLYIYINPAKWNKDEVIEFEDVLFKFAPDVVGVKEDEIFYVEIDNFQTWQQSVRTLKRYIKLKELKLVQEELGYFPQVVWLTHSVDNYLKLKAYNELDIKVLLWEDIRVTGVTMG